MESTHNTHLTYANDTMIFTSADARSFKLVMDTLAGYEEVIVQKINMNKSATYMHHQTSHVITNLVCNVTTILKKDFLFTYVRVPLFYERTHVHYKEIIDKVQNRLSASTGKLLSV